MRSIGVLVFLISLASTLWSFGQEMDWLDVDGKNIVDESGTSYILKGMGLGGWMLQEGYMLQTAEFADAEYEIRETIEALIGEASTDEFYEAWLANHVRKIDIDSLASWGFNSVRLPMHYKLFTLPIEEEPVAGQHTWLDKGFELTDQLIDWCRENNMYVVLDLHGAPGGQGGNSGISDYDPSKPSLWESQANKDKTVALWRKLAERYADEPVVAGYDLLNEPNWNLPGGTALRNLYVDITNAIREVDTDHILFIEGNWYANDFTDLTPPWDSKLVYSPHKYWSINGVSDMQFATSIRDAHNVPLYVGETGENSNVWFRDAIKLFEELNVGWAWWPMKKVESISGPLSVTKSQGYIDLLEYWKGNGPAPLVSEAKATLMQLAEDLKLENCRFQPDVIDAMFRQIHSDETKPYTTNAIPGIIYATDYDMGRNGFAYFDKQDATYHVTTGNYTSWNDGWAYRNDGVDIQFSEDVTNSNGFNVGWIDKNEWMKYSVEVGSNGVYDIEVRVASETGGSFRFMIGDTPISSTINVPNTGGWQTWQTVTVEDVVLGIEDKEITYFATGNGVNLGSFKFIQTGNSTDLATSFISIGTSGENKVIMILNKSLVAGTDPQIADFSVTVDNVTKTVNDITFDSVSPRVISLAIDHTFSSSEEIKLTFTGEYTATDGTTLTSFSGAAVENNIAVVNAVGDVIEAEDFFAAEGVETEVTTDVGGGLNVSYLDVGDYMDYMVEIPEDGTYTVTYRTASETEGGGIQLRKMVDGNLNRVYHTKLFDATGGWQNWTSTSVPTEFKAGVHQLRLQIAESLFNLNWFKIEIPALGGKSNMESIRVYPNPSGDIFYLDLTEESAMGAKVRVIDLKGNVILEKQLVASRLELNLSDEVAGLYLLEITHPRGGVMVHKIIKN